MSALRMVPAPVTADWYRDRARDLLAANAALVARNHQLRGLIERQAERIELLEALLAPPGKRGMARLRRSPVWVRLGRRLGWVA